MVNPAETAELANPEDAVLGRYRLRYRVAMGGMASVYLAQLSGSEDFRKWVAIKTVHPHIAENRKFIQMFMNEARLAARLDHPNICTVFDFGETRGTYYLAMEYLHGESLNSVVRRAWRDNGMPLELAARMVCDAARGLHAAHELKMDDGRNAGVVHRDVSPQNIFVLYNGVTKVVDFGIARSEDSAGERTATGELKGKVAYLAPEQLKRDKVDRRADIWALGTVLWEITLGQRLFKRDSEVQTLMSIVQDPIPRPTSAMPEYPLALEAIVMRALERNPAQRYQTALEMARDLENFLASMGRPTGPDAVAEFMSALFAEQISAREQLLRKGNTAPGIVVTESPSDTSLSEIDQGNSIADEPELASTVAEVRPGKNPYAQMYANALASSPPRSTAPPPYGVAPPNAATAPFYVPPPLPALAPGGVLGAAPVPPRARQSSSGRGLIIGLLGLFLITAGVAGGVWLSQPGPRATTPAGPITANSGRNTTALPAPTTALPAPTTALPAPTTALAGPATALPAPTTAQAGSTTAQAGSTTASADNTAHNTHRSSRTTTSSSSSGSSGSGSGTSNTASSSSSSSSSGDTQAAAPPAVHPGFLNLSTNFPAQVYDGSRALGSTPIVDRSLSPGHHTLRLVPTDGSPARSVGVDISSGATSVVRLRAE